MVHELFWPRATARCICPKLLVQRWWSKADGPKAGGVMLMIEGWWCNAGAKLVARRWWKLLVQRWWCARLVVQGRWCGASGTALVVRRWWCDAAGATLPVRRWWFDAAGATKLAVPGRRPEGAGGAKLVVRGCVVV